MKLIKLDQTYKNQLFNMMEEWLPTNKRFNIFLYDEKNDKLIGAFNIRHSLDERLLRNIGHIGGGIRPSKRKKDMQHLC